MKPDPRIQKALDSLDLNFGIDEDGDFRFTFGFPDGRSQLGFIQSQTYDFAGMEMREVFSAGLRSEGTFDARTAEAMLVENSEVKLGAWVVREQDGIRMAFFTVRVPADLAGEPLLSVIQAALKTADDMEVRFGIGDEF